MVEPEDSLSPEDLVLASTLEARRPAPTVSFRSALGQRIAKQDPGYSPRPARLWARAGLFVGAGTVMIVLGLLVSTGAI